MAGRRSPWPASTCERSGPVGWLGETSTTSTAPGAGGRVRPRAAGGHRHDPGGGGAGPRHRGPDGAGIRGSSGVPGGVGAGLRCRLGLALIFAAGAGGRPGDEQSHLGGPARTGLPRRRRCELRLFRRRLGGRPPAGLRLAGRADEPVRAHSGGPHLPARCLAHPGSGQARERRRGGRFLRRPHCRDPPQHPTGRGARAGRLGQDRRPQYAAGHRRTRGLSEQARPRGAVGGRCPGRRRGPHHRRHRERRLH